MITSMEDQARVGLGLNVKVMLVMINSNVGLHRSVWPDSEISSCEGQRPH